MILFIQTAFLGDLLLSIPVLKRIRQIFPDKQIHLLCRKNLGSLLLENKIVDVVYDSFISTKPSVAEVRQTFKTKKFDLLVCPHESFRSSLVCSLIKANTKIGFSHFYDQWIFTHHSPRPMHYPEPLRQLSLLQLIDSGVREDFENLQEKQAPFASIPSWASMAISSYQNEGNKKLWKEDFGFIDNTKIVCLAPGSVWATKQWGTDKYADLAKALLEKNVQVVIVGAKEEKPIADEIQKQAPQVQNRVGQTNLSDFAKIIAVSDCVVCNDSGAMHVAAMAGSPVFGIFGPTVQAFGYQPWTNSATVIENKNVLCRPCASHGGHTCPLGTHECMKSLDVELVHGQVCRALGLF
jgi:heptosyltransferase-2